ncbi:MAG: 5-formyltetrahydrofolate cyclo-ligase [Wenyingzhuangia sp.]|jgi:5-formyltetrahydrofolate cyclo-ligase|uniref:5-formyltetrahydrofolate cyclo-ligase n=1 Tax=Wenyingzhuangia sp. TaxID=1964193 RepID=UPI00321B29F7
MKKNELRKKYKSLRQDLSLEEVELKSMSVANQLLNLPIWNQTYYHLFLSIQVKKEIDTEQILHVLFAKNKEVVVSKSDFETNTMNHFLLTENTRLKVNDYGIPEPKNGLPVPEAMIEVVFVPLLAFDQKGNRVGYGKGFYDKFLQKCDSNVIKIGLSFFEPVVPEITDIHHDDVPLNYCVTPNKIYCFDG